MTSETTRHTSHGTRTQLVATAADVISRAMQQGRTLPAALAASLEAAQLLQSPTIAARLAEVEKANAGLDDLRVMALDKNDTLRTRIRTLEADREASDREYEAATARVAELEAERHATNAALSDAAEQLRRDRDRIAELEAAQGTVYRASHDSIVMGLYRTREAAQAHCEAAVQQEEPAGSIRHTSWSTDDVGDNAEYELHITPTETGGLIRGTGYVVTVLEVAAEHDEEADQ
ncbi:hypothetical protein [Streptomyces sp. NPDC048188]|uniref:hypothetical protein n=1 Tax=Streptomyces sp. NPDC048188 TaxID=3155749 RepID=UPI0034175E12